MITIALIGVAVVVGVLIGATGVGGVVFAPALIAIGDVEPHQATAISMCCFLLCALASVAWHLRNPGDHSGRLTCRLAVGLLPGAFGGGWLNGRLPATVLVAILAVTSLLSGIWILVGRRIDEAQATRPGHGPAVLALVGLLVGLGSGITGTSGPMLLVPALLALRYPLRRSIAVGQVAQVFVTPAGVVGYLSHVHLDLELTAVLGVTAAAGVFLGTHGARRLPGPLLRDAVAVLLIATCAIMVARLTL